MAGAEPHEERAEDRGDDADPADGEREGHHPRHHLGTDRAEEDCGQNHGRDRGDGISFEQIRCHTGTVADIVADIIGNGGGIARIVLRNTGFDLADQIAADVGAFGENSAAEPGEDRDQRSAEAERDQGIDHGAVVRRETKPAGEEHEIERHAEEREAGDQKTGDGAGAESDLQPAGERADGGLRGTHVGAHGHIHADEAGGAGEDRADGEPNADKPAEEIADNHEDDDADERDRGVLPP